MDVAKLHQGQDTAVMAVTHSKSNNVIGFFWNDFEIVPRWIMREPDGTVTSQHEMGTLHRMAMGMSVVEDHGRLQVKFGLLDRPLFLADTGEGLSVVFQENGQASKLKEIYVDLARPEECACVCLCETLIGRKPFTETLYLNLSFMESFM